uniref:unspecific monooxygenase n=1 Tax=Streltzoviella insularis TaxID=1206366 RepID=A0A7D5YP31_9NEOP|nr:cytochrome P450 36 [Streltzoviella insularis]
MIDIILLATILVLALITVYLASIRKFNYWKKKGVPHLKPTPILGNFSGYILLKEYTGEVTQRICQKFPDEPYVGAFYGTEPALIVQDPELIKLITTKDFYYFNSREISKYTTKEVITQNLFFTYGERWKVLRQNLTPLFTSAKMKKMFYLIEKCAHVFEKLLDEETAASNVLEVRELMVRYTMDCIGSCAFGVETNTMRKSSNKNPFTVIGTLIFEISNSRGFQTIARAIWPFIFYGLGFKNFPTEINDFFGKLLTEVFQKRQYKPSTRNDFVDLVLNLKQNEYITGDSLSNMKTGGNEKISLKVDDDLLIAQCVVFFAAGFETSATTMTFALYELAKNDKAQERVLEEIDEYLSKHGNKLGYECLKELPYLEACFDETLRLYPVLGVITREVVEDYTLPTGLRLEKGDRVHLPLYHLHRDPRNFPEPEQFRPERFLGEEKQNIKPYIYFPFGEGPRICIGMRFAKMQMLPGLVTLLKKYRVELAPGTPRTVQYEPKATVTQPKGDIKLKFLLREGWEKRIYEKQNVYTNNNN